MTDRNEMRNALNKGMVLNEPYTLTQIKSIVQRYCSIDAEDMEIRLNKETKTIVWEHRLRALLQTEVGNMGVERVKRATYVRRRHL